MRNFTRSSWGGSVWAAVIGFIAALAAVAALGAAPQVKRKLPPPVLEGERLQAVVVATSDFALVSRKLGLESLKDYQMYVYEAGEDGVIGVYFSLRPDVGVGITGEYLVGRPYTKYSERKLGR